MKRTRVLIIALIAVIGITTSAFGAFFFSGEATSASAFIAFKLEAYATYGEFTITSSNDNLVIGSDFLTEEITFTLLYVPDSTGEAIIDYTDSWVTYSITINDVYDQYFSFQDLTGNPVFQNQFMLSIASIGTTFTAQGSVTIRINLSNEIATETDWNKLNAQITDGIPMFVITVEFGGLKALEGGQ